MTLCEEKLFKCTICFKEFSTLSALDSHMSFHTKEKALKCNACDKLFSCIRSLNAHMLRHEKKQSFVCGTCKQEFCDESTLKKHMNSHSSEKPYVCEICGKRFLRTITLVNHVWTHSAKKPFECELCDKGFPSMSKLNHHMIIHTGEKPFECKDCGKRFATTYALSEHMKKHTGEKPFGCELCGKCFSQKSNLKTHKMTHTGERPYECTVCRKKFAKKATLHEHLKIHTGEKPFSCSFCGKSFTNKSTCDTHMKTHIRVEKHHCLICAKGFYNKNNLKSHIRSEHQEKTPFECTECGKKFPYNSYLLRHMVSHNTKPQIQYAPSVLRYKSSDDHSSHSTLGNEFYHSEASMTQSAVIQETKNSLKCKTCGKIFPFRGSAEHSLLTTYDVKCKDCNMVFKQEISIEKEQMEQNNTQRSEYNTALEYVTYHYNETEKNKICKLQLDINESLVPSFVKTPCIDPHSVGIAKRDSPSEEAEMKIFSYMHLVKLECEQTNNLTVKETKAGIDVRPKDTLVNECVKEELEDVQVKEEGVTTWDYID